MARHQSDFHYIERRKRQDEKLHAAILADGDDAAAKTISDSVARDVGLSEAEIAALATPPTKPTVKMLKPMKPHSGESQSDFMARCVPEMIGTGADKRPQEQAVAICMDIWRNTDKSAKQDEVGDTDPDLQPDDDEEYDDWMDRCTDQIDDEDQCQLIWDNRSAELIAGLPIGERRQAARNNRFKRIKRRLAYRDAGSTKIRHKTHAEDVNGMEFVLSDETPDRMDDIILSDGWELENFKKNPIALFGHHNDFPIGKWQHVRVEDKQLRAHLQLAPKGTSDRIDEIGKLIEAGILKAVSVGFVPLESKDRHETKWGSVFTKCELVETSLVAVPANPNALAVAKSLKISPTTLHMVFGEHASGTMRRDYQANRGEHADDKRDASKTTGEHAEAKPKLGKGQPMLLSQRIQEAEKGLLVLQDQLERHVESVDDDNPTEEQMVVTEDLTAKIEIRQLNLGNLKTIEAKNASGAEDATALAKRKIGDVMRPPGDLVIRRFKKPEPLDYFFRAAVVRAKSRIDGHSIDDTRRKIYGDDEATKVVCDIVLKAASAPAETTVAGWAQELVHTIWADFMQVLLPMSVFPKLSAKGLALTFGSNGKIVIPTRSLTPSIAGSFVGEGMPIPVRQGAFSSQTVTPKKMAVITTWTKEMDEYSTPAIEGLLRQAIMEDTAIALDTVLLDANPATTIRPAGLRSYQTGLTPAAGVGTPFANFVADYSALYGQLLTLTNGNVRSPTIILNPIQVLNLSLIQPPAAAVPLFPFIAMTDGDRVLKADLIESSTVAPGMAIMVDAADFTTAGQEGPRLEISDQATLHMEDTTPLDIVGGVSPGTPAWPTKSMWQTDSLALRLIMFTNWIMRRPISSWMTGVLWH
jgi:HK97 family phage prohead protease